MQMRGKYPTLDEAIEAADTIERFLDGVRDLLAPLRGHHAPSPGLPPPSLSPAAVDDLTWKDKVTEILKEAGRPLRPIEISNEYTRRGWTAKRGKLGHMIRATLAFMKREGLVRHDSEKGTYSLP